MVKKSGETIAIREAFLTIKALSMKHVIVVFDNIIILCIRDMQFRFGNSLAKAKRVCCHYNKVLDVCYHICYCIFLSQNELFQTRVISSIVLPRFLYHAFCFHVYLSNCRVLSFSQHGPHICFERDIYAKCTKHLETYKKHHFIFTLL